MLSAFSFTIKCALFMSFEIPCYHYLLMSYLSLRYVNFGSRAITFSPTKVRKKSDVFAFPFIKQGKVETISEMVTSRRLRGHVWIVMM